MITIIYLYVVYISYNKIKQKVALTDYLLFKIILRNFIFIKQLPLLLAVGVCYATMHLPI